MAVTDPPAVRWIPGGERPGIYIYTARNQKWACVSLPRGFVVVATDLPSATEPLFSLRDVELAIDAYRETRNELWENARASGELDDLSSGELHAQARADTLVELSESADYAITIADLRYEQCCRQ